jgi:hypothetical protein
VEISLKSIRAFDINCFIDSPNSHIVFDIFKNYFEVSFIGNNYYTLDFVFEDQTRRQRSANKFRFI